MPPKKQQGGAGGGKKTDEKVKKIVDDKTFGLKNKSKSAKVQRYVDEVKKQASEATSRKQNRDVDQQPTKKQLAAERTAELAEIFTPVQVQKVPFGTDPKTVLCVYFRAGECTKGNKCKFSHDLEVARKSAKIDLYTDKLADEVEEEDKMEGWDRAKLDSVIVSKHGNPRTKTDIVCKYFLESIEESKYGWFWVCPNGGDACKYRHALPPGYVLSTKKTLDSLREDESAQITLEEFLEMERHKLSGTLTRLTAESFAEWKNRRLDTAAKMEAEKIRAKETAVRSGRRAGLSGRELFAFNPELLEDGQEGGGNGEADNGFDLSVYVAQQSQRDQAAEQEACEQSAREQVRLGNIPNSGTDSFDEQLFAQEMDILALQ